MILRDSQVRVVSFVDEYTSYSVIELLGSGQIKTRQFETITHEETDNSAPIIWLILINNVDQISEIDIRRYHANHEQYIYLVCNQLPTVLPSQLSHNTIFLKTGENNLLESIAYSEQRILQRQHFVPLDVDEAFIKLNFYGRSSQFVKAVKLIKKVSKADANVFIKGETGTGKELTARAIHYLSERKEAPFIPINCGAFSDDLILSELFGHEKGAFTGADKSKKGLLEMADNGTVFLDEVDSLSSKAQVALLRYLQDSEVRQIGSNKFKKLNVRIIAASNANIREHISNGSFREDLMYRLDVLQVTLPQLKKRGEDIQLLAQHFLAGLALVNDNKVKVFHPSLIAAMHTYNWEGNVRELDNFVKRAYFLTEDYVINDSSLLSGLEDLDGELQALPMATIKPRLGSSFQDAKDQLIYQFERDYLAQLLTHTRGNVSKAAKIAKKERRSFCRLMQKHGLDRSQFIVQAQ
ncbi:sigma-54-dependent Fis family transcriptional regulator [Paraneptunicella aestuarii]|uniref:sigma 54-interacting transcriptional regulator n=1 Tax=Paraneptunicella aestuarii TaxID=2831148 RepID=UPI001E599F6A|nr:sigma-54 dependent transcriptional regulator [Paraneptunicella aestuarii]UAA40636.1 sigma-54-dependent Fis family transcriptional regulator [Paraneptunicella aestuarii]